MGKKKVSWHCRDIPLQSIASALTVLNITSITKSNKMIQLGLICEKIGRKNNAKNRLAVDYIIKKNTKWKLDKRTPKQKYRNSVYANVFTLRRKRISLGQPLPSLHARKDQGHLSDKGRRKSLKLPLSHTKRYSDKGLHIKRQMLRRRGREQLRWQNRKVNRMAENCSTKITKMKTKKEKLNVEELNMKNDQTVRHNYVTTPNTSEVFNSSGDETVDYDFIPFDKRTPTEDTLCSENNFINEQTYSTYMEEHDSEDLTKSSLHRNISPAINISDADRICGPKIPMEIIGTVLNVPLQGVFFTREISPRGSFPIQKSDWEVIEASSMKRRLKRGSWHHIMIKGNATLNPFCTFMVRRHHINVPKFKARRKAARLFHVDLYCSFKDCDMKCILEMYTDTEVHCIFIGKLKHDLREQQARPISGIDRTEMKKDLKYGQKPYRYYLKRFAEIPDTVKVAGNMSHVGSSPNVVRQIASEAKKDGSLDPDEWISLLQMSDDMANKSAEKSVKGFIQHISIKPCFILYWNDAGVRLWHHLAKDGIAFWDATGSIVSELNGKRHLYYELALANPIPGEPSIPVTSMLSTSHDTPQIRYWISKFRHQEKNIFGHKNIAVPKQVNSDRSLVFIQNAIAEFNGENLDTFRSRAWRIITGRFNTEDLNKTIPHACLSHTMKNFRDACRLYYKANFEYGMYILSVLVNVQTFSAASQCLKAVLTVLMSRNRASKVEEAASFLDTQIQLLPDITNTDAENTITEIEDWLTSSDINPNLYTEEDYTLRKKSNEFSIWADGIQTEVRRDMETDEMSSIRSNKRHSSELAEYFLKNFISFFPIWSNILLGDLTRHERTSKEILIRTNYSKQLARKTNAIVEQRFRVLKDIAFGGEKKARLDIFSLELESHFETIQKLAVLRNLKTSRKPMRKASKTIEEGWNKKGSLKVDVGKYQTAPKKKVTTFAAKQTIPPRNQANTSSTVVCEAKEDVEKLTHLEGHQTNVPTVTNHKDIYEINHFQKYSPPAYLSKDMITDLASKQFQTASMMTCINSTFESSQYLNELYKLLAKKSLSANYLETFKEMRTGLLNLGVSCWFNAVMQLFSNSVFMKNIDEQFVLVEPHDQGPFCEIQAAHF